MPVQTQNSAGMKSIGVNVVVLDRVKCLVTFAAWATAAKATITRYNNMAVGNLVSGSRAKEQF